MTGEEHMAGTKHKMPTEQLREDFVAGKPQAMTDDALLQLLVAFAVHHGDPVPATQALLDKFGGIDGVLAAPMSELVTIPGIKDYTATLFKLVEHLRVRPASPIRKAKQGKKTAPEPSLFSRPSADQNVKQAEPQTDAAKTPSRPQVPPETTVPRPIAEKPAELFPSSSTAHRVSRKNGSEGTGLFAKAYLAESVELLPRIPLGTTIHDLGPWLRDNMGFSAESMKKRAASYVSLRLFPSGVVDDTLLKFARAFAGHAELTEACFYRFCQAEPLMYDVVENVLRSAVASPEGVSRAQLLSFLRDRAAGSEVAVGMCTSAILKTLRTAGIVTVDGKRIRVMIREPLVASFAFVLYSEFGRPGMYSVDELEQNRAFRAMLWDPLQTMPMLYELRNRGLLSKVSEIDGVRQFTTHGDLGSVIDMLCSDRSAT
jgi:DNA repair protein RadC